MVALAAFLAYLWLGLPGRGQVRALAKDNPGLTGVMRQREKEARAAGRTPRRQQTWVPLSRVSRHLVHAVLSSEDQNFFVTTHKSPARKLRELLVAHWLEDDLGKRRILELYLNVIEWGDGVYGAE